MLTVINNKRYVNPNLRDLAIFSRISYPYLSCISRRNSATFFQSPTLLAEKLTLHSNQLTYDKWKMKHTVIAILYRAWSDGFNVKHRVLAILFPYK